MNISTLTKAVVASAFIALGSSASASAQVVDLGELEAGKEYSWPQYSSVKGTYTPKESGVAKFVYSTTPLALYSSPDHNENSEVFGSHSYSDLGQVKTYTNLEGGKTYYLYHGFVMDKGTLVIYEGSH